MTVNLAAETHHSPGAKRRRFGTEQGVWALLGLAMALYAALQLWLTRGTTLFIDEVMMFLDDRGLHPSALAAPFNEHLEFVRRLLYAVCFKLFGAATSFMIAKPVEIGGVIVLAALVFAFLKRRVGAPAALAPVMLLLFFGSAWELNFAISGIGNVFAIASGIGALMLLDRRSSRSDALACLLLLLSVVSFTSGVAFAVGALCLLLVEPHARRRAWVAVAPLAVYGAWLAWVRLVYAPGHGAVQYISPWNLLLVPNTAAQQAASTAGAFTGLNHSFEPIPGGVFLTSSEYGGLLAAFAAGALAWRLRRGASPLLWALIATLVFYWIELALGYGIGRTPSTVRYAYAAAVIAILIAAEAVRTRISSRLALAILYALTAFALGENLDRLREGMQFYRSIGTLERAQLGGIQVASPSVEPSFTTLVGLPAVPVTAGPYLAAVARNGSPAYSGSQLQRQPEALREAADAVLVAALRVRIAPHAPGERGSGCQRHVGAPSSSFSLPMTSAGVDLTSPSAGQLAIGQLGSAASVPIGSVPSGQAVDLRTPRDDSTRLWRLRFSSSNVGITVCQLSPTGY